MFVFLIESSFLANGIIRHFSEFCLVFTLFVGMGFSFLGGGGWLQYFPPYSNKNNGHEKQSPNRSKTFYIYIADEKDDASKERQLLYIYFLITRLQKFLIEA